MNFRHGVQNVARAFPSLLTDAHIHGWQSDGGSLHDAAAGISQENVHLTEETPIGESVEIYEDMRIHAGGGKGASAGDKLTAAGVGVGIEKENLIGKSSERLKEWRGLLDRVPRDGHGMISDKDRWLFDADLQDGFESFTRAQSAAPQVVQRRCAGPVHAPLFFVHGNDAAPGFLGGSKVNMAHLGEGIAYGVVNRALADFAALDMRDGDPQGQRYGSRREHFVAVGDQEKNVRAHLPKTVREAHRSDADGLGHADVGVGTQQTLKLGRNREAIHLYFTDGVAKFGREMRTQHDEP